MRLWFSHNGQDLVADHINPVIPILDAEGNQHLARWGATVGDALSFPRGQWYRYDYLKRAGAIWVRVPVTQYEGHTMYKGPLTVMLQPGEFLLGALVRSEGDGARTYLVTSDVPGLTTVVPLRWGELRKETE